MWFSSALMLGSSPLARGLPLRITTIRPPTRIIPARAGFTSPHHHHQTSNEDHPRSRGVYGDGPADVGPALGSSPLARGLPDERGAQPHEVRIIPARAGFTRRARRPAPRSPDHPRSRGVYPSGSYASMMRDGSSPLARGLHSHIITGAACAGIIPARAGFTRTTGTNWPRPWDHPRSRGVYSFFVTSVPVCTGSSPLARGLLGWPISR